MDLEPKVISYLLVTDLSVNAVCKQVNRRQIVQICVHQDTDFYKNGQQTFRERDKANVLTKP